MVLVRALVLLIFLSGTASAAVFNPHTTTLDNGLQVIVVENPRAPVVLHMLWYKTGSADEPAHPAGLAHFLEHMMFKGTTVEPEQDFSAAVSALGGSDNAFTGYDYTAFFQKIHPDFLPDVMHMEAERMRGLELSAEDIRIERDVVMQERAQTSTATPQDRWREKVSAAFYAQHPYSRPIIGWGNAIADFDQTNVRAYYDAQYAPNNAILIASGDIKAEAFFNLARDIYGSLPPRHIGPRQRSGNIATAPGRLTQVDKDVRQPQLVWMWPAVSARTAAHNDANALQVLAEIMNAPDGLLQKELVLEQKAAVGVSISYDESRYDATSFTVSTSPTTGHSLDNLERALKAVWPQALATITEADLARAKRRLRDSAELARDNIFIPAYAFGLALTTGSTIEDVENWPDRIATVSLADIRRVAADFEGTPLLAARLDAR
ncbi:MAG: M16 family metallopeptidase [Bdellovibrionales bacterium]